MRDPNRVSRTEKRFPNYETSVLSKVPYRMGGVNKVLLV